MLVCLHYFTFTVTVGFFQSHGGPFQHSQWPVLGFPSTQSLCTRVAHAFCCPCLGIQWGCPYTPGTPQLGPLLLNWKHLSIYFKGQLDLW